MAEEECAPDFTVHGKVEGTELACMGFSPDGTLLALGFGGSADCSIINVAQQRVVETLTEGHAGQVSATAFSPDGEFLATGSNNVDALIWRVRDWKLLHREAGYTLRTKNRIPVAWGPNSDMLACSNATDKNVKLIVKRGEDSFQTFRAADSFPDVITTMAFSPDGTTVAACDRNKNLNLYAVDLRLETPLSLLRSLPVGQDSAPVFFSPDSSVLWVVKSGVTVCSLEGNIHTQVSDVFDQFVDASVAPEGQTLVVASRAAGFVQMLDLNDLSATRTTLPVQIAHEMNNIAVSPSGDVALSVGGARVAVYRGVASAGLTKAAR